MLIGTYIILTEQFPYSFNRKYFSNDEKQI